MYQEREDPSPCDVFIKIVQDEIVEDVLEGSIYYEPLTILQLMKKKHFNLENNIY